MAFAYCSFYIYVVCGFLWSRKVVLQMLISLRTLCKMQLGDRNFCFLFSQINWHYQASTLLNMKVFMVWITSSLALLRTSLTSLVQSRKGSRGKAVIRVTLALLLVRPGFRCWQLQGYQIRPRGRSWGVLPGTLFMPSIPWHVKYEGRKWKVSN